VVATLFSLGILRMSRQKATPLQDAFPRDDPLLSSVITFVWPGRQTETTPTK